MSNLQRQPTNASVLSTSPSLPPYSETDTQTILSASEAIELENLGPSSPAPSESDLPTYEGAITTDEGFVDTPGFVPTQKLQIQSAGKRLIGLPLPPRPDPIPVYDVTDGSEAEGIPLYVSLRFKRGSGSCSLVRGDDDMIDNTPLCNTTYRFGMKPPKIALFPSQPPLSPLSPGSCSRSPEPALGDKEFEFVGKATFSRACILRSHLGTFEWRYPSRKERRAAQVDSLILFERVVKVALAGGKSEEKRTLVAQFVRTEGTRTSGTRRSTAGNGGRLLMDLREWADAKGEMEEMRLLIVSTCISMLKKEVDRRRALQTAVLVSAASGGA